MNPIVALRRLRYRVGIEDPKSILIYFYEGNDLEGNLTDLSRRLPNYFELMATSTLSEEQFHNYLDEAVLRTDGLVPPDVVKGREIIASKFIAAGFLWNVTQRLFGTWNRPGLIADTITNIFKEDTPEKKVVKRNEKQNQRNVVDLDMGTTELPANLQGPALQLTEEERQLGITLFEYSLTYAQKQFKNSEFTIVYVPSVLFSYRLRSSVTVQRYLRDRSSEFESELVYSTSNWIAIQLQRIARQQGIRFIDPRKEFRASGRLVHGPKDFKHFNRTGYEILSRKIMSELSVGAAREFK